MKDLTERVGLIAGDGVLPVEFIKNAKEENFSVIGVGLTQDSFNLLKSVIDDSIFCPIGEPMRVVNYFKMHGVKDIGFAGKVEKKIIFKCVFILEPYVF